MTDKLSMPRSLRKKWLDALRSGKYKQGSGTLYNPDTKAFCCLGVLEHQAMDGQVEADLGGRNTHFEGVPSEQFYANYGMESFHCSPLEADLIRMNDTGESFEAIADKIQASTRGR